MYPKYSFKKTLIKSARTALMTLVPVIAGDLAFEAVQVELVGTVVIPLATAGIHALLDAIKHGGFNRFLPMVFALALCAMPLTACQTSLNEPLHRDNIVVLMELVQGARAEYNAARADYREALVAEDDAKLLQAQRRIDIAVETIQQLSALMDGAQPEID
jgi:hypothetical protein